ncbi:hypothetical protein JCM5350_001649 [Sporobolomyces pararoseus]
MWPWKEFEIPPDRRVVATRYPESMVEPPHCYATEHDRSSIQKMDRISRLPNELLDSIFEFAYTEDHPPTGPLSKRLRPWFDIGLYRRVKFETDSTVAKFVRHIVSLPDPRLARLVESITLDEHRDAGDTFEPITHLELVGFFSKLTRLESLDLGNDEVDVIDTLLKDITPISSTNLPSLRKLRVPADFSVEQLINFRGVTNLSYSADPYWTGQDIDLKQLHPPPLTHLTNLTVTGEEVTEYLTVDFCSLSPNLSHLHLDPSDPGQYVYLLPLLPTSLKHLELLNFSKDCYAFSYKNQEIDDLLPRFSHLEHLTLGHYLYSNNLPIHLSQLKCLRTLVLWPGSFSISDFLLLVYGPTRLPLLRKLVLNLFEYKKGLQLDCDAHGNVVQGTLLSRQFSNEMWFEAEFVFNEEIGFTKEGIEGLISIAEQEGIEVEGSVFEALKVHQLWLLEISNYLVYRAWEGQDVGRIENFREEAPDLADRLPPREYLQSLDPTRLQLVRTELPEEEWFILSLTDGPPRKTSVKVSEPLSKEEEEPSKEEEQDPADDSAEESSCQDPKEREDKQE